MKKILWLLLSIFITIQVYSHPWKPGHYVIIDTDCGIDDLRAISLLLASPEVRVLGILATPGVLPAEEGYKKINSLLAACYNEGILTGAFTNSKIKSRNCVAATEFPWGDQDNTKLPIPDAINIIRQILENSREKISWISLGSLELPATCIDSLPLFGNKIKSVLWTCGWDIDSSSFNYALNPGSYQKLMNKKFPLHAISFDNNEFDYSENLAAAIKSIENPYSQKVYSSIINSKSLYARKGYDEIIPVFLHDPDFFTSDTINNLIKFKLNITEDKAVVEKSLITILKRESLNRNQVIKTFPLDTSGYLPDIQPIVEHTIKRFGEDEWVAGVMANEMHRHLGVYAVIGVKMGMRAREYFGAGIDEMKIVSSAGLIPPFSCMNDGLQISTGATVGHGLIRVNTSDVTKPEAVFTYMNRSIQVTLKDEYRKKIEKEIKELSVIYGLDSDIYWDLVRSAALKYWSSWDRHDIFYIQYLTNE